MMIISRRLVSELLKIIFLIAILFCFIYIFKSWIKVHDINIIKKSIKDFHINDIYNENETQYIMNRSHVEKEQAKIPWGINQFELVALLQEKPLKETNTLLCFSLNNQLLTYKFNQKGSLFSINEQSIYSTDVNIFGRFHELMYTWTEKLYSPYQKGCVVEINWLDELGHSQSKMIESDYFDLNTLETISKYTGLDVFSEEAFNKLIFTNNLIYEHTSYANSTKIEIIIKKNSETSAIIERIFTHEKLING